MCLVPAPEIIAVEMHPKDAQDLDRWYREEHLDLLAKVPGYRRTLRYKIGPRTPLMGEDVVPGFLAIHEVEDVGKALGSEEAVKMNETEWTKRVIGDCDIFVARGWRLVKAMGYEGV
jgi:hypothetical protein